MGDLFGGQILKRKWRKMYNFPEGKGTQFYMFTKIEKISSFRNLIEMRVNGMDMKMAEKLEQLEEMKIVFKYNTDMIIDLLEVAKSSPDGFLAVNPNAEKSWATEMQELGAGEGGGCMFAPKKGGSKAVGEGTGAGQCPLHKVTSSKASRYTSYGLLACATMAIAYPLVKRVWHGQAV